MSWSPATAPLPRVPRWRPASPPIAPTSTRCDEERNRSTRVWGRMRTGSPAPTSRTWSRPEGGRTFRWLGRLARLSRRLRSRNQSGQPTPPSRPHPRPLLFPGSSCLSVSSPVATQQQPAHRRPDARSCRERAPERVVSGWRKEQSPGGECRLRLVIVRHGLRADLVCAQPLHLCRRSIFWRR
jgi:hypothetical protein